MVAGIRSTLVPALVITMGTVLLPLSGCKIVRNDQRASTAASSAPAASGFDAAGYVDGVWDKKLVPYFDSKQVPQPITTRPDGVKQLYVQDPDGYWIEINDSAR